MKKFFILSLAVILSHFTRAQSVAINLDGSAATDSSAMLEIKKASKSKVRIRSLNYSDTSQLEFSNRSGTAGTDMTISLNRELGLLFSSKSDLSTKTQDSIFSMRLNTGKVFFGMNIAAPLSLLHIHDPKTTDATIRLTNSNAYNKGVALNSSNIDASLTNTDNGNLFFGTNNIIRGGFNKTGDFGVGITNPAERLSVSGNISMLASPKGILQDAQNSPLITRGWDPFTSGTYAGIGRWGFFMEPGALTVGIANIAGRRFQVAKYNANSTSETLLAVEETGKVTKPSTGAVNLLPICMGVVLGNGVIVNGSGNFSVFKTPGTGINEITINGESYNANNNLVQVTCIKTTQLAFAMTQDNGDGKLRILTYRDDAIIINCDYQFVVYKLN